jgi:predicted transcriptional regulator
MKDAYLFDIDEKRKFMRELDILECLTQKRIEVLRVIAKTHPQSIRALSRILERNVKNVFEDLLLLEKHKFISFQEKGKSKKPVVLVKKIVFHFKNGDDL